MAKKKKTTKRAVKAKVRKLGDRAQLSWQLHNMPILFDELSVTVTRGDFAGDSIGWLWHKWRAAWIAGYNAGRKREPFYMPGMAP